MLHVSFLKTVTVLLQWHILEKYISLQKILLATVQ